MKQIGIFLAYAPEQPIKNQGIGRLIAFILSGILEEPNSKVVIASPDWYRDILINFLQDQKINDDRIELLTTNGIPYLLRFRNFISKRFKGEEKSEEDESIFENLMKKVKSFALKCFVRWLSTPSTIAFILYSFMVMAISIALLPLLLVFIVVKIIKNFIHNKMPEFERKSTTLFRFLTGAPLKLFKNSAIAHKIYNELRAREFRRLVRKVNQRQDIKTWFVPSLFWPEIKNIKARKVVAAPDVVFVEFPTLFSQTIWHDAFKKVKDCLSVGDHYICYSEHVKQNHLVKPFYMNPDKISVIHHGFIQLDKFFKKKVTWHNQSLENIRKYQKERLFDNDYLRDFDFTTARFIFYSSQIRPHKNFMNLIRAVEILTRKRFANIKLVLTADIDNGDKSVREYLEEHHLYRDVIWLPDVPTTVLASLNHLAICAVNPTLFEGGFPFTFTEAYSVGTPSLMSNIEVVSSLIDDASLREKMLFDPYSVDDMVNKIEWAIHHRNELLKLQQALYDKFKERSWKIVAKEYIDLIDQYNLKAV